MIAAGCDSISRPDIPSSIESPGRLECRIILVFEHGVNLSSCLDSTRLGMQSYYSVPYCNLVLVLLSPGLIRREASSQCGGLLAWYPE